MTRSCWAWDWGGSEGQEPLSEDGAGGGAGEGQPRESDRISSVSWTKASFFCRRQCFQNAPYRGSAGFD